MSISLSSYVSLCLGKHSTAQHSTAQHSTAQHSTAQHSTGFVTSSKKWFEEYTKHVLCCAVFAAAQADI
jgi:hypothetical protein